MCLVEPDFTHFSSLFSQHEAKWHPILGMPLSIPPGLSLSLGKFHEELINCRMHASCWILEPLIKMNLCSLPCSVDNDIGCMSKPQGWEFNIYPWMKAFSFLSQTGKRPTQCKSFVRYNNYLAAIYLSLPLNSNSISWKQFIVFSFSLILCCICFSSSLSLFCTWRYYKVWGRRRIEKLVLIYARRDTSFALYSTPWILETALDHAN